MFEGKRYLCVIPARCGSKRIPQKNIQNVASKPLIAWSIEAANQSLLLDKVIVSTDCKEIAEVAETFGADIPFIRPSNIAGDTHNVVDAIIHAINFFEEKKDMYDYVMILQPTSPLRTTEDIDKAIRFLHLKNADAVVSVCESEISPRWIKPLPDTLEMSIFSSDTSTRTRSQDLEKNYRLNGSIYIVDTIRIRKENNIYLKDNIYAHVMERFHSIDIDEPEDLLIAEALLQARQSKKLHTK